MNGILKKILTAALSTALLISAIPAVGISTVAAQSENGGYVEQEISSTEHYEALSPISVASLTETNGAYSVASESDWAALVNAGGDFAGKTVVLTEDITFTSANGSLATFAGTLDGNGHTLKGVKNPLIVALNGGAVIKNLIVDGASIDSNADHVAVLAGTATPSKEIKITDVAIRNATVKGAKNAAGMIGSLPEGPSTITFTNCTVSGTVTGKGKAGGLLGSTTSGKAMTIIFNNCKNSAALATASKPGESIYMGGMAAYIGKSQTVKISDCENVGDVTVNASVASNQDGYFGGFIGRIRCGLAVENSYNAGKISVTMAGRCAYVGGFVGHSDTSAATFTKCVNEGDVKATADSTAGDYMGGIVGFCGINVTVLDSANYGTIMANATVTDKSAAQSIGCAGGIVAAQNGTKLTVKNTANLGTVLSADSLAGGIVALALKPVVLEQCVNAGDVFSGVDVETKKIIKGEAECRTAAGMLAGTRNANAKNSVITGCINTGYIVAPRTAGGMIGYIQNSATTNIDLSNCTNSGDLLSMNRTGGIIADTNAPIVVKNCVATGNYFDSADTAGVHIGAIGGRMTTITVENCYASVTLNGFYTAWIGGKAVEKTESEMLSEMAALNLGVQKSAADGNGKFNMVVLAGMNELSDLTKVGFEVIRIVDGKLSRVTTEGTTVYTSVEGYDENGAGKEILATEYANVKYFSALEIKNISNEQNVTYLYRPYAVRTAENAETTLYGAWNSVSCFAVA